jgi:preprotein translocase subunit SecG
MVIVVVVVVVVVVIVVVVVVDRLSHTHNSASFRQKVNDKQ